MLFEALGAIAIGTGPRLGAIPVAAIFAIVGVFDAEQLEILFPVWPFFLKRRRAEASFDPVRGSIFADSGLFHVVKVFVPGN